MTIGLQCIAQGVVTFVAGAPVWNGEGIAFCTRFPLVPNGAVTLLLDEGLPGNAGAVPTGAGILLDPNVRTIVTIRGTPGVPPATTIATKAVLYLPNAIPGVGSTTILIVTLDNTLTLADPFAMEVVCWRVS